MEAFIQAYQLLGYEVGDTPSLEPGIQKIAIYTNYGNIPTHVARQLPNGNWSSKLGSYEDIEYTTLESLTGDQPAYGKIACYMAKELTIG